MSEEAPKRKRHHGPRPAQLTLEALRGQGFTACIVERYNSFTHTRHDCFGYGDILAFLPDGKATWLVQACGGGEVKAHLRTALAAGVREWTRTGGRSFMIVEWRKMGASGKRKVWVGTMWALVNANPALLKRIGDLVRHRKPLTTPRHMIESE